MSILRNSLFILGLIVLVSSASALSVTPLESGNLRVYHIDTGLKNVAGEDHRASWYLLPYYSNPWFYSLSPNQLKNNYSFGSEIYQVDKSKVLTESDVLSAFVYNSETSKYIQIAGSGTDDSLLKTIDYNDVSTYPVIWIYPKKNISKQIYIQLDKSKMPPASEFTLKKGWNYFFTVPDMIGREINSWKGTCNLERFAGWNDEKNQWGFFSIEQINSMFKQSEVIGGAMAVKVASDCKFAYNINNNPITPPPLIE